MKTETIYRKVYIELKESKKSLEDLKVLKTLEGKDEKWAAMVAAYDIFFKGGYKKDILSFLENLRETELHNAVAALSYRLNSRGLGDFNPHWREHAKLSIAAAVLNAYMKVGPNKRVEVYRSRNKQYQKIEKFIGDPSIEVALKDATSGVTFSPQKPKTKVAGKAGMPARKLNSAAKKTLANANKMQHRLVNDVEIKKLYKYLLTSKEYIAVKEGKFLSKTRKYSNLERRLLIKDRLDKLKQNYKRYIKALVELKNKQESGNFPLFIETAYDYRGRVYYTSPNPLLNPQTKIGKYMWESFKPRVLNELDYKYIVFVIMSTLKRLNPNNAIAEFEKDVDKNISKFLKSANGYLEELYHKRVVQAYYDYLSGTPNATYLFTDYTNSGAIRFAAGLSKERKALRICNLLDYKSVMDPHKELTKAFNKITNLSATRDDIKKAVSQSITAGVSPKSAVKKAEQYFLEAHSEEINLTEEVYLKIVKEVYGDTGELFHLYNKIGNSFYNNEYSELNIMTRDGFPARSIAYLEGYQSKVFYISSDEEGRSFNEKLGYDNLKSMSIVRHMPLLFILNNGKYVPAVSVIKGRGDKQDVESKVKMSGALANATHADDAVAVRAKIDYVAELGGSAIFIHDNDGACGMLQEGLLRVGKQDLLDAWEQEAMLMALKSMSRDKLTAEEVASLRPDKQETKLIIGDNFMQA